MQLVQKEKHFLIVCQSVNGVVETDDSSDCESINAKIKKLENRGITRVTTPIDWLSIMRTVKTLASYPYAMI